MGNLGMCSPGVAELAMLVTQFFRQEAAVEEGFVAPLERHLVEGTAFKACGAGGLRCLRGRWAGVGSSLRSGKCVPGSMDGGLGLGSCQFGCRGIKLRFWRVGDSGHFCGTPALLRLRSVLCLAESRARARQPRWG